MHYTMAMAWNYWLFVAFTVGLTAGVAVATHATARLLRVWKPEQNLLLHAPEQGVRLALIGVCWALGTLSGLSAHALGWHGQHWREQLAWGIGVGLLLALFFTLTTRLLLRHGGGRFYSSVVLEAVVPRNRREFGLVLLALIPVVALEELLFRSLLLAGLAPIASPLLLLLGFGLLFGLLHSPQGIWGMAGAGLAGIVFGVLFLRWESLLAPLVAHYVANAVQIGLGMVEMPPI